MLKANPMDKQTLRNDGAELDLIKMDSRWHIAWLNSKNPGAGAKLLRQVTAEADKEQKPVYLMARWSGKIPYKYSKSGKLIGYEDKQPQLEKYYSRFGFVRIFGDNEGHMVRKPKSPKDTKPLLESVAGSYLKLLSGVYSKNISKDSNIDKDKLPYGLLLKYGRPFQVDKNTYKGKKGQAKMCFMNAGQLAGMNPDLVYCEGYMVFMGTPLEHAWVCNKQGIVIDPTVKSGKNITEYFGIPIKKRFLNKVVNTNKVWGVLGHSSIDILQHTDIQDILEKV